MRKKIIAVIHKVGFLRIFEKLFHILIGKSSFKVDRNNTIKTGIINLYKSHFKINGEKNTVEIDDDSEIHNLKIRIRGNNNKIIIGEESFINELEIFIEGNNNTILMGSNFFVFGKSRFYVVDGGILKFGKDCMLSDNIEIRATDNHSIIDLTTGRRFNYEEDIIIGEKVWIGTGVTILKGAEIADHCIIGAKSLVAGKKFNEKNCVIAGNPAKIVRRNVTWIMERVGKDYNHNN